MTSQASDSFDCRPPPHAVFLYFNGTVVDTTSFLDNKDNERGKTGTSQCIEPRCVSLSSFNHARVSSVLGDSHYSGLLVYWSGLLVYWSNAAVAAGHLAIAIIQ